MVISFGQRILGRERCGWFALNEKLSFSGLRFNWLIIFFKEDFASVDVIFSAFFMKASQLPITLNNKSVRTTSFHVNQQSFTTAIRKLDLVTWFSHNLATIPHFVEIGFVVEA